MYHLRRIFCAQIVKLRSLIQCLVQLERSELGNRITLYKSNNQFVSIKIKAEMSLIFGVQIVKLQGLIQCLMQLECVSLETQ